MQRILATAVFLLLLVSAPLFAQEKSPSARWEKDIAAFEEADRKQKPPEKGVLFVGASGIKLWKTLEQDFPEHKVLNRGFGGSQIADVVYYADRIVIPYKPRLIVLQSGGNDINAGKTPEQVAADFQAFVEKVRPALPDTKILFMSLQPAPARWSQFDKQKQTNKLIADYIAKNASEKKLVYIDAFDAFLTADGQPREDLFVADKLHHNAQGYQVRTQLVKPYLK